MRRGIAILAVLVLAVVVATPSFVEAQTESYSVYVTVLAMNYYAIVGTNYTFGVTVNLYAEQNVTLNMNLSVYVNGSNTFQTSFSLNVTLTNGETADSEYRLFNVSFLADTIGIYDVFILTEYNTSEGTTNETQRFYIVVGDKFTNGPVHFETGDYLKYEVYQYGVKSYELTLLFGEMIDENKINVTVVSKYGTTTYNSSFVLDMSNRTMSYGYYSSEGFPFAVPQNLTENSLVPVGTAAAYLVKGQETIEVLGQERSAYVGDVADFIGVARTYFDVETGVLLKSLYNSSYYIELVDTNIIQKTSETGGETGGETGTTGGETGTEEGTTGTTEEGGEGTGETGGGIPSFAIPVAIIAVIILAIAAVFVFRKRSA